MNRVYVAIPSFRPSAILVEVCNGLRAKGFSDFVVVDDGSPPHCAPHFAQLRDLGITVLRSEQNFGKGAAIKIAIQHILQSDIAASHVVFCDDDLQHHPDDVSQIVERALATSSGFVLGARDFSGSIPWKSRLGNTIINWLLRVRHSIVVADSQSGLRCFDRATTKLLLSCRASRFGFELETLIRLHDQGITALSVPIRTIYHERNANTRFRPLADSIRVLRVALSSHGK